MYVRVCACMSLYAAQECMSLERPQDGAKVIGSCELPDVGAALKTQVLCKNSREALPVSNRPCPSHVFKSLCKELSHVALGFHSFL